MAALGEESSSRPPSSSSFPQHGGALPIAAAATIMAARGGHVLTDGKPRAAISVMSVESKASKSVAVASRSHPVRGVEGSLPTRSSQRQIKRPKTDDELIDFDGSSRTKKHRAAAAGGGASSKTPVVS